MFDAGAQIIKAEGVKSLFKGAGANILRKFYPCAPGLWLTLRKVVSLVPVSFRELQCRSPDVFCVFSTCRCNHNAVEKMSTGEDDVDDDRRSRICFRRNYFRVCHTATFGW